MKKTKFFFLLLFTPLFFPVPELTCRQVFHRAVLLRNSSSASYVQLRVLLTWLFTNLPVSLWQRRLCSSCAAVSL
ncbi:hypothetical protein NB704_004115 [Pantoea ananatis]|nr:hypothetical protein [Pantoea ananatis]